MDDEMKLKKQYLEAEKQLKKVEQDYLHANQKYTETRSQWESLYDEERCAINRSYSAATFVNACNEMIEKLQKALDKLPTTEPAEEAVDHIVQLSMSKHRKSVAQDSTMIIQKNEQCQRLDSKAQRDFRKMKHQRLQFPMVDSGKSSGQENVTILQQKAQCQKLDPETISDIKAIQLDYIPRKLPRSDSRNAINKLLNDAKEKNKCRDKALLNCTLVCNPTNHQSLRKSVELEIKVLKKLIRELKKDWDGKLQIKQYATSIYKDFRKKMKHQEEEKEHLSGQWDEEKKRIQEMKENHNRICKYPEAECINIGTYPTAEYIKMVNDKLP